MKDGPPFEADEVAEAANNVGALVGVLGHSLEAVAAKAAKAETIAAASEAGAEAVVVNLPAEHTIHAVQHTGCC